VPRLVNNPLAQLGYKAGYLTTILRAEALGCSLGHLYNIERGRAGASDALVGRIAGLYGVTRETVQDAIKRGRRQLLERIKHNFI
jgi:hypothetical protein